MYKFLTDKEEKKILKSRAVGTTEEIKKRLTNVDNTDVLIIPFNKLNHFTYKYRDKLILHYPSKKFLGSLMTKYILKKKLPMQGIILISNSKDIVPFAECIINNIFLPEELNDYWNEILNKKQTLTGNTLYQIYKEYFKDNFIKSNSNIDNAFEIFFKQVKYDDMFIMDNIIKLNEEGSKVHTGNSALLWIECEVLEHITASHIHVKDRNVSFRRYLKKFEFYGQSIAYGLPINEYLRFRTYLKNTCDYTIGKEALRRSFVFLDEINKIEAISYMTRYKVFSEQAWRDMLCKEQLIYRDNELRDYILLFHLIWEIKNNKSYDLIDYDTEVRCSNVQNKNKNYFIDAYIQLYDISDDINIKLYLEFKNYSRTIYDKAKDYDYQPKAILENKFYLERYKHKEKDKWYYVAVTKGSPYKELGKKTVSISGLKEENYINFTWKEIFTIMETKLQQKAYESIDKSLLNFLRFLERI